MLVSVLPVGSGDDRLRGGDGNDSLFGSSGDNNMAGGAGNDAFHLGGEHDVITDFQIGQDVLAWIMHVRSFCATGTPCYQGVSHQVKVPIRTLLIRIY